MLKRSASSLSARARAALALFVTSTVVLLAAPQGTLAANANLHLGKTVGSATLTPNLALSLAVDRSNAIPGDRLTYTSTLTNTGATLAIKGDFQANSVLSTTATVASYWDYVATSANPGQGGNTNHGHDASQWPPFVGVQAAQPGYTPDVAAPIATGLTLALTPVPAAGVTYPTSGDPILGTTIAPGATALWHYTATATLTPAQVNFLLDPNQVAKVRNSLHLEVTPRNSSANQAAIVDVDFGNAFFGNPGPSGTLTGASITIQPPQGAAPIVFNSGNTIALGSLAPGASVTVTAPYTVTPPAAKGASETDAAYLSRLQALEGAPLSATASASGTAVTGTVSATAPAVSTTEHLPVVSIGKTGPATSQPGGTSSYSLALANAGGATAGPLAITDSLPDGTTGSLVGVPASLAPGASATVSATLPIPASQPAGALTDTAGVSWKDANGNLYGPVSSSFTTQVVSSLAGAHLVLAPATAGPDVTGTSQTLTATLTDRNGQPLAGKTVSFGVTGVNPTTGSGVTDAGGNAVFQYTGANSGTDVVQAAASGGGVTVQSNTASVSWVTPIVTVSTSPVHALFFQGGCGSFCHSPGQTPAFTQDFPVLNFNPPAGTVPNNRTGVGVETRPFTDITTDVVGNFTGSQVAQGNGFQAGNGALFTFDAVFTANYTVAAAGDVTFNFFSDDGFIFGVGNGATRVSGPLNNAPATSPFQGYPVMGAYNQPTAPVANNITVHFPAAGTYPYEVDYSECCGGQIALLMGTGGKGIPPTGNISLSPTFTPALNVGQTLNLAASVMDASGNALAGIPVTITVTGANNLQLSGTTDATGYVSIPYSGTNAGTDAVVAQATVSAVPEISNTLSMTWNPAPPAPVIGSPAPADGTLVTKPVPVTATITPPAGQSIAGWQVTYQGTGGQAPTLLASGSGTPPAILATFDPSVLANDLYAITVSATASGGGVQTATSSVTVSGNLKPGRFVTTYQDMSVPVAGFSMQVRRTYDSYDKRIGDFGVGWRVSVANFRVTSNHTLGASGWSMTPTACFIICHYQFKNAAPRFVSVVYPDNHTEVFDLTPAPTFGLFDFWNTTATFTARAGTGTTSTLADAGNPALSYDFGGNLIGAGGVPYNPTRFSLTTRDGRILVLDTGIGLVSETDPSGNTLTVDANGLHSSTGASVTFTRDSAHGNRITRISGPDDGVNGQDQHLDYGYDAGGRLATVLDQNGFTKTYTYDPVSGDLMTSKDPNGQPVQTLTYGPDGRLQTVSNGGGPAITVNTAAGSQQQVVQDANGLLSTVFSYDDRGDIVEKDQGVGGRKLVTRSGYDGLGRITDFTDPLGHHRHWVYDESNTAANGNLLSYTDPENRTWQLQNYDAHGHPGTILAPDGSVLVTYTYDPVTGLTRTSQQPGVQPATFTYYANGLLHTETDPSGAGLTYTYNAAGFKTSVSDSAGRTVTYNPDAAGRVLSAQDESGNLTQYQYNGIGDLVSVTDPDHVTRTFHYNGRDALDTAGDPSGSTTYLYNPLGLISQRTDRNGAVTTYRYDVDGRLLQETRPNNDVLNYQYDALERLTEADNAAGELNLGYDDAGNLASQVSCAPQPSSAPCAASSPSSAQPTVQLAYGYNGDDQVASVTGPDGATAYHYDGNDRLDTVTDQSHRPFGFSYNAQSRLGGISLPNGIAVAMAYNDAGQLTSDDASLGATVVSRSDYAIDPVTARRASSTTLDGTSTYAYQDNGWLQSASHPAGSGIPAEAYTYDGAGNRTSWPGVASGTAQYDPSERLTAAGSRTLTYDPEGDLLTSGVPGSTTTYHWNADHQLLEADLPGGAISTYRYDPLGRRIETNDSGAVTRYVWDVNDVHAEYDGSNAPTAAYTLTRADTTKLGAHPALALEVTRGGVSTYYLHDGLDSTVATTDGSGTVNAVYRYDTAGRPAPGNGPETRYTYAGAQLDRATGLYYMRDRYYDPSTGRFISQDPAAAKFINTELGRWTQNRPDVSTTVPVAYNLYAYASNDAVDYSDPSGDISKAGAVACVAAILMGIGGVGGDTELGHYIKDDLAECAQAIGEALKKNEEANAAADQAAEMEALDEEAPAIFEGLVEEELVEVVEIDVQYLEVEVVFEG